MKFTSPAGLLNALWLAQQTLCSFWHKHSLSKYLLSTYCVPNRVTEDHSTESGVEVHQPVLLRWAKVKTSRRTGITTAPGMKSPI